MIRQENRKDQIEKDIAHHSRFGLYPNGKAVIEGFKKENYQISAFER